jgi:prophage regulatory protein
MTSKILRLAAVKELTGLSRSSIYLQIARGTFPRQVSLGARAVGWREIEITAWLESLQTKSGLKTERPAAQGIQST